MRFMESRDIPAVSSGERETNISMAFCPPILPLYQPYTYLDTIKSNFFLPYIFFKGSLEDQLSRLREYEEAIYQFKPHLEELERINQQIQESFVFENRYTQYTMETLRVGWEQLVTSGEE